MYACCDYMCHKYEKLYSSSIKEYKNLFLETECPVTCFTRNKDISSIILIFHRQRIIFSKQDNFLKAILLKTHV